MKTERSILTDELLSEKIETLQAVIDMATDLLNNPKLNITDACNRRGLNPSRTRSFLLYSTKIVKQGAELIPTTGKNELYLSPEEELYRDVFEITKKEVGNAFLPLDLRETIFFILEQALSEKEKKCIIMRYGLEDAAYNPGGFRYTLEAARKNFGCSRQRVQQIEKKALNKLRHLKYRDLFTYGIAKMQECERKKHERNTFDSDIRQQQKQQDERFFIRQRISSQVYFTPVQCLNMSVRLANCIRRAVIHGKPFPANACAIDLMLAPVNLFDDEAGFGVKCKEELMRLRQSIALNLGFDSSMKAHAACRMLLDKYNISDTDKHESVAPALLDAIIEEEIKRHESTASNNNKHNDNHLLFMGNEAV